MPSRVLAPPGKARLRHRDQVGVGYAIETPAERLQPPRFPWAHKMQTAGTESRRQVSSKYARTEAC
jgi:hypothetical protein